MGQPMATDMFQVTTMEGTFRGASAFDANVSGR